jgi:pimeloyl-ACP methyl ester carboxylesterase
MSTPKKYWPSFTLAADGTSIAWDTRGEGMPIIFTNGYATSHFYWDLLRDHLVPHHKTIVWDLKGHGRSGPAKNLDHCSIPHCADDLRRVMDAAGIEKAVLAGFSLGCQIIFEAWRQIPDRISGLIPVLGTYGHPFDNAIHPAVGKLGFKAFERFAPPASNKALAFAYHHMKTPWSHPMNKLMGMVGRNVDRKHMQPFYDHFSLIDGPTWARMGVLMQGHSAEDVLATIDVPTLIIAGGKDLLTPPRLSRHMNDKIAESQLLYLPKATHAGLYEYPNEIANEVDRFLDRHFVQEMTR